MQTYRIKSERNRICALLLSGVSIRNVSELLGMSKSKIARVRKSVCHMLDDKKKGRPSKLSSENKRLVLILLRRKSANPQVTSKNLLKKISMSLSAKGQLEESSEMADLKPRRKKRSQC